jgi:hypothetical protein
VRQGVRTEDLHERSAVGNAIRKTVLISACGALKAAVIEIMSG